LTGVAASYLLAVGALRRALEARASRGRFHDEILEGLPGETTCREDAPCGQDTYGDIPVDEETEFVDAARPAAIVAGAAGRYEEDARIFGKPVRLWGRCPRQVERVGTGEASAAVTVLRERASASELRDLAVTGPGMALLVDGAASVPLARVWVHEAGAEGSVVDQAESASLMGSRSRPPPRGAPGLRAEGTPTATGWWC
jgi:hypothetical protein